MTELSQAAVERIIKKTGVDRVSADATEALSELMEEHGMFLAKEAKKMKTFDLSKELYHFSL